VSLSDGISEINITEINSAHVVKLISDKSMYKTEADSKTPPD